MKKLRMKAPGPRLTLARSVPSSRRNSVTPMRSSSTSGAICNASFPTTQYLVDSPVYGCPSTPGPAQTAAGSDYTYVGAGLKDADETPTQTAVAYCDNHRNWINVLYVDGHVKGFRGETIEETGAIVKVPER